MFMQQRGARHRWTGSPGQPSQRHPGRPVMASANSTCTVDGIVRRSLAMAAPAAPKTCGLGDATQRVRKTKPISQGRTAPLPHRRLCKTKPIWSTVANLPVCKCFLQKQLCEHNAAGATCGKTNPIPGPAGNSVQNKAKTGKDRPSRQLGAAHHRSLPNQASHSSAASNLVLIPRLRTATVAEQAVTAPAALKASWRRADVNEVRSPRPANNAAVAHFWVDAWTDKGYDTCGSLAGCLCRCWPGEEDMPRVGRLGGLSTTA